MNQSSTIRVFRESPKKFSNSRVVMDQNTSQLENMQVPTNFSYQPKCGKEKYEILYLSSHQKSGQKSGLNF